ncbi:hypothetical protein LXL04_035041 [Taraxacum kok-saghyz]
MSSQPCFRHIWTTTATLPMVASGGDVVALWLLLTFHSSFQVSSLTVVIVFIIARLVRECLRSSRSGEKKNFGEKKIDSKHVNLKLPPSAIQQAGDEERRGRLQGAARRFRLQGAARRFRLQRWFVLKLSREGDEEERRSRPSFTVALSRSRDGSSIRG